jgi:hypothetical protein
MGRPSTASFTKVASSVRQWSVRWLGAGAGASVPVKQNGNGALTRQGVGLYTWTLGDVGGKVLGFYGKTHTVATVAGQNWKYVGGSFSAANKTVQIECWSEAGALADPVATVNTVVELELTFLDNSTDAGST